MASSIPVTACTPGTSFFDGAGHAEFDMSVDSSLALEDQRLAPLADFWHRSVWRGRRPRRQDFHPGDFRTLLSNLLLLDRLEDREETRFRLVGTALTGILRRDSTGRRIVDSYEPRLAECMLHNLDFVIATCSPARICTVLRTESGGLCRGEALLIPLFATGAPGARVSMVLGGATWSRFGKQGTPVPTSALHPWDQPLLIDRPRLH